MYLASGNLNVTVTHSYRAPLFTNIIRRGRRTRKIVLCNICASRKISWEKKCIRNVDNLLLSLTTRINEEFEEEKRVFSSLTSLMFHFVGNFFRILMIKNRGSLHFVKYFDILTSIYTLPLFFFVVIYFLYKYNLIIF